MLDPVPAHVGNLAGPRPLVPISGDQYPPAFADLRKKRRVLGTSVPRNVLFVYVEANPTTMKFIGHFGAVPILIKEERVIMRP